MQDSTVTTTTSTATDTLLTNTKQFYHLEDFLIRLGIKLERAHMMVDDVIEKYFGRSHEALTDADRAKLFFGYYEYQTKACIASDYLHNVQEIVQAELAMFSKEFDIVKGKGAAGEGGTGQVEQS